MASLAENTARAITAFDEIKTAITKNGVTVEDGTPVEDYPDKVNEVFSVGMNDGYSNGYGEGIIQGIDEGRQAQYEEFWDEFQQNGKRTDYRFAFNGHIWNYIELKPKYNMQPTNAYSMFHLPYLDSMNSFDLVEKLEEAKVTLDFSKCTNFQYCFNAVPITHIGIVDTTAVTSIAYQVFWQCAKLHTIDKLIIKADGTTAFDSYTFSGCNALENLTIKGTIGRSGLNFQHSKKLSKDSILSVFNALSTETEELSVTFSKTAVNNAFGINVDDETTYTDEWKELTASKSNWTIAFA